MADIHKGLLDLHGLHKVFYLTVMSHYNEQHKLS
jgi:hypothetical protein